MIKYQIKLWASACTLAWVSACGGGGAPTGITEPIAPAAPTAAGVIPCSEDEQTGFNNPALFLTQQAEEIHCRLAVNNEFDGFLDENIHVGGFAGLERTPIEVSRYSQAPDTSTNLRQLFPPRWQEIGTTGNVGELWWGRAEFLPFGSDHWSIGQLTTARKLHYYKRTGDLTRMMQMGLGQISPFSSALPMTYALHDATLPTFRGGRGDGSALFARASVREATLELHPSKPISGVLDISFQVEGHLFERTLPLRSMVSADPRFRERSSQDPDDVWAMRAAQSIGSQADCIDPGTDRPDTYTCFNTSPSPSQASQYSTKIAFYGANAEYAVVHYFMEVDRWDGVRGDFGEGLIVLRLQN